jgi:DNA-binding CsgD family transcriptional regulator
VKRAGRVPSSSAENRLESPVRSLEWRHDWITLFAAKTVDAFRTAVFPVIREVVACDFVSVHFRGTSNTIIDEADSLGRVSSPEFMRGNVELMPATALVVANPEIRIVPTRTGLNQSEDELRRSAYHREIMQIQGGRHAVALYFWRDPAGPFPAFVISAFRERNPDFSDVDLASLSKMHEILNVAVLQLLERLANSTRKVPSLDFLSCMTKAEREVSLMLAEGLSNQEIADRLGKTIHAVKFRLHRIYKKAGIAGRTRLVAVLYGHRR